MAYTAASTVWPYWNQAGTNGITTTAASTGTWSYWNQASANGTTTMWIQPAWTSWNIVYEETAEQKRAREEAAAAYRAQEDSRREQKRAREEAAAAAYRAQEDSRREQLALATSRAEELLMSLLSGQQAADYREHGWFEVRGSKGGRWRIRNRGKFGNVDLMPEIGSERDASYCAHPPGNLPAPDAHLAQMLALVTDEDQFLKVANRSYARVRLAA